MTFFLLWIGLVGAVSLSIRYDVSEPVQCHADDDDFPTSCSLQLGRRPLGSFHVGGWRPWRGCQTSSCTTGKRHLSSAGKSTVLGRKPPICCSGLPCGTYLQFGTENTAYTRGRRLGFLEGDFTLWATGSGQPDRHDGPNSGRIGKENEDDTGLRPRGRRRVHRTRRRCPSCLVPAVFGNGGGLASRGGGPHFGTAQCSAKKVDNAGHRPLRGLRHLRALRPSSSEGLEIQNVCPDLHGLHDERVARPCNFLPVANLFQVTEDFTHHAGRCGFGCVARVRDGYRTSIPYISSSLALDLCGGRGGEISAVKPSSIKNHDGHQGRKRSSRRLQPEQTLGLCVQHVGQGRDFLEDAGPHTGTGMDCVGEPWRTEDTGRTTRHQRATGRHLRHSTSHGERLRHEGKSGSKQSQKEEEVGERRRRRWRRFKAYKGSRRKERREQRKRRAEMLRLEQWQRAMWGLGTGATMCSKGEEAPQVHEVRLPRASKPELHKERMKSHATGDNTEANNPVKPEATETVKSPASYTYTYETEDEEPDRDEGNEEPEEETPLQADTLEEYFTKRVFIFVHHYAGVEDPLTTAMRNEALAQGIRLKAFSIEKEKAREIFSMTNRTRRIWGGPEGVTSMLIMQDFHVQPFPVSGWGKPATCQDLLGPLQSPMAWRTTPPQNKPNATGAPSWLVEPSTWQRQCVRSPK